MEFKPLPHFRLPPGIIDIPRLERESRKYLYLGMVVGMLVHLAAAPFVSYPTFDEANRADTVARPMKADLVVLPPRIANPYENWRREFVPRTYLRKEFSPIQLDIPINVNRPRNWIDLRPNTEVFESGMAVTEVLRMIAAQEDSLIYEVYPDPVDALAPPDLAISREPEDRVWFEDELIDFDDIDALGEYKAVVVRDLSDKQNLRGYFHIPQFIRPGIGQSYIIGNTLVGLTEAFNYYTGLELKLDVGPIDLSSKDLMAYPVIYFSISTQRAFELEECQAENLRTYIDNGGFIIMDNARPWRDWTPAKATILAMLISIFGPSVELRQIPATHPVSYCFFDFVSLPPEGAENWPEPMGAIGDYPVWGDLLENPDVARLREQTTISPSRIWSVYKDGRLAAVFMDKGYGHIWREGIIANQWWDPYSRSGEKYNFNPQIKYGVNLLVYALLQEGGIARRLTDYTRR